MSRATDIRTLVDAAAIAAETSASEPSPARGEHARLDAALAAVGLTAWTVDASLALTWLGGAGVELLGGRLDDLLGRGPAEVFLLDAPDHPHLAAYRRVLAGETVELGIEWQGTLLQARMAPLRAPDGTVTGCAGFAAPLRGDPGSLPQTLSEREERLRLLVDESPVGIFRAHRDGPILEANDAFLEMIGYEREDLAAGRVNWKALTPSEFRARDRDALREIGETGRCAPYEKEYLRRDGTRVRVLLRFARVSGRVREAVASVVDLTARRRVEQRLLAQLRAASVLSSAESVEEAGEALLRAVAESLEWSAGGLWLVDGAEIVCRSAWHDPAQPALGPVVALSRELRHTPGSGLPGRVWSTGEPEWIPEFRGPTGQPRSLAARRAGIRCAVAVPVWSGSELLGVLEFGALRPQRPDDELIATLLAIARQLGLFLERRRLEREREEAQRASRVLLERLRVHVERMPIACMMGDASLRVVEWNPAAERIFGWSRDEMLGFAGTSRLVPLEAEGVVADALVRIQSGQAAVVTQRNVNVHRSGRRIVCDWVNTPLLDEEGRFAGFVSMAQDVTDQVQMEESLRASEARYRSIVETTREGVWIGDQEGRTRFANARLAELMACRVEDLLGRSFLDFVPEADQAAHRAAYQRSWTDGRELSDLRLVRSDGTIVAVQVSVTPLHDERGAPAGVLAMLTDVTERRALELQLLQSQKMEALGRLAGGVAHDFNNLLTVISGCGELLAERMPAGGEDHETLEELRKAASRAASLTRQLMTFSRQVVVEVRTLDLNARIADGESMLRRLLGEDVELVTILEPGLAPVRAEPSQVDQMLLNLVVNARDAMPRGGTLTIRTERLVLGEDVLRSHPELHPGAWIRLSVSDTGVGIDPERIGHVFEPFFTTKEPGRGTGLGLATVYGIAKNHGGHVTVASDPGRETRFEVYLPVAASDEGIDRERAEAHAATGSGTVLLVEDEHAVRAFARRVLVAAGYRVLEAADGREALARAETWKGGIDVLVTDVVMPRMGGRELAEALRQRFPALAVLYVSGYTDDAVLRHGVLRAEAALLPKPFSAAVLASKVREVLAEAAGAAPA